MTSTVDTFIYLQRDIEQTFQRLQTSSFASQQDYDQLLHHLSCTLDDLEEVHRLLPPSDQTDEINAKSSSSVSFAKFPSFDEREEYLRRMRKQCETCRTNVPKRPMETVRLDLPLDDENEDQLIRKQDEHLEHIHHSIVSLKNLSQNIHQEIDDHLRVLDHLGTGMTDTHNQVENLHRQTKNFLQRSGDGIGGHTGLFSIAVLLFFLIVILILFF